MSFSISRDKIRENRRRRIELLEKQIHSDQNMLMRIRGNPKMRATIAVLQSRLKNSIVELARHKKNEASEG